MKTRVLLLFLLFTSLQAGFTQQFPDPSFNQLDAESLGVKKALYQTWDSEGKLWAVTDKGLVSFNGYHAKIIPANPEGFKAPLSDNIRTLARTDEDEFWLTYSDRYSISRFNPLNMDFRHFHPDSMQNHAIPATDLARIFKESDSTYWLLTWGDGLCRLHVNKGVTHRFSKNENSRPGDIPGNFVKDMVRLNDSTCLVGFFEEGKAIPHFFNPLSGKFREFPLAGFLPADDPVMSGIIRKGLTIVNFIHHDDNGNFWFGTYIGLFFVDMNNKIAKRITYAGNDIYIQNLANTRNYVIDDEGLMWIGTQNQGILVVNRNTGEARSLQHKANVSTSLADDRILNIETDPFDNIWVSTHTGVFSICNPRAQKFHIHPWKAMNLDFSNRSVQQIPVNQISVMPDGNLLISNRTGLVIYSPTGQRVLEVIDPLQYRNLPAGTETQVDHFRVVGQTIHFIIKNKKGQYDKAGILDLKTRTCRILDSRISPHGVLFRHNYPDAPFFFFSAHGEDDILAWNGESDSLQLLKTFPAEVSMRSNFSLLLDNGKWLFPTEPAFMIFDPVTLQYEQYSHNRDSALYFPDSIINCGVSDDHGMVWFGTTTGLYSFDPTSRSATKHNKAIGILAEEEIYTIAIDQKGIFWIALSKDLVRWNRETGEAFRYDRFHGLQCGSFIPAVAQQDEAGRIYIATYDGILVFDPDELEIPENKLRLYLSQVSLLGKNISRSSLLAGSSVFRHDENFLAFEFYTNQVSPLTPHRYFYRLSGQDENWQDNGLLNRVRLADLNHGDYQLEVKAVNTFGHESNIIRIPFTISKPYWLSWWFFALIGVAVLFLAYSYMKYRERTLRRRSLELERQVTERTAEVVQEKKEAEKQRLEAEHQKEMVEEKQKEITDSINYAKRIQDAYLPAEHMINAVFEEAYIYFRPKDIVSGDFYWFYPNESSPESDNVYIAAADCTGHGVPGAIMSVICCNALHEVIINKGISDPGRILDEVREIIIRNLKSSTTSNQKDGMDIALCRVERQTRTVHYAGAHNPLWIYRNNSAEIEEIKADKQPVGMFAHLAPFTSHTANLSPGDMFFLFSDGFADQFGGPKGKKFKSSSLRQLLVNHAKDPVAAQKLRLDEAFNEWKGDLEQLDDVCVIGVRMT